MLNETPEEYVDAERALRELRRNPPTTTARGALAASQPTENRAWRQSSASCERFDEAEPLLLQSHAVSPRLRKVTLAPSTQRAIQRLIELYEAWDKLPQADEWRAKTQR